MKLNAYELPHLFNEFTIDMADTALFLSLGKHKGRWSMFVLEDEDAPVVSHSFYVKKAGDTILESRWLDCYEQIGGEHTHIFGTIDRVLTRAC